MSTEQKTLRVFNTDLTEDQYEIFQKIVQKRKYLNISPIGLDLDLEGLARISKREGTNLTEELNQWLKKL